MDEMPIPTTLYGFWQFFNDQALPLGTSQAERNKYRHAFFSGGLATLTMVEIIMVNNKSQSQKLRKLKTMISKEFEFVHSEDPFDPRPKEDKDMT